jgi:hypothetical protein
MHIIPFSHIVSVHFQRFNKFLFGFVFTLQIPSLTPTTFFTTSLLQPMLIQKNLNHMNDLRQVIISIFYGICEIIGYFLVCYEIIKYKKNTL